MRERAKIRPRAAAIITAQMTFQQDTSSACHLSRSLVKQYLNLCYNLGSNQGLVQGSRYLLGQRFSVCFVLKLAPQRGKGEKREGVQISKQTTQPLTSENISPLNKVNGFKILA